MPRPADGSGVDAHVLEDSDVFEAPRATSADGRYLIYRRRLPSEAGYHIWALPLTGEGKPFPVVQDGFDEDLPSVSRPTESGWHIRATNLGEGKSTSLPFPAAERSGRFRAMEEYAEVAQGWEGIIFSGCRGHDYGGRCEYFGRYAEVGRAARVVSGGGDSAGFWSVTM